MNKKDLKWVIIILLIFLIIIRFLLISVVVFLLLSAITVIVYLMKDRIKKRDLRVSLSFLVDGLIITGLFLNTMILDKLNIIIELPFILTPRTIWLISSLVIAAWYFLWIGLLYVLVMKQFKYGGLFNEKKI